MPIETPVIQEELPEKVKMAVFFANEKVSILEEKALRLDEMHKEKVRDITKLDMECDEKRVIVQQLRAEEESARVSCEKMKEELAKIMGDLDVAKSDLQLLQKEREGVDTSIMEESRKLSQIVEQIRELKAASEKEIADHKVSVELFESRKQAVRDLLASI
jgi:chromosome segregation ATPase